MERFFILDKFNTWYDWRSYLTSKDVTPPEPKTNYIELDGMNGTLDLSESLTGEITYKDRTITATFWTSEGSYAERERLLQRITGSLHGKKIKIIEPDDPDHYFYGRVKIKSRKNILPYAEYTIEANCEPWRYAIDETVRKINMFGTTDIVIHNNGVKTLSPVVTTSNSMSVTFDGNTIQLPTGSYVMSDLRLRTGANVIRVTGYGNLTFTYREADL